MLKTGGLMLAVESAVAEESIQVVVNPVPNIRDSCKKA